MGNACNVAKWVTPVMSLYMGNACNVAKWVMPVMSLYIGNACNAFNKYSNEPPLITELCLILF